jgi:uncharacterized membrane protein YqaE (UPF0057 family)
LFALVTLNYWLNPVGIAEDQCFSTVQRYSESLVVGAIIAKERGVVLPKKANLAPATVGGTGIDPIWMDQGYALLQQRPLPDIVTETADRTDADWSYGVSRAVAAVLLHHTDGIERYIGRTVSVGGKTRYVLGATESGNYVTLFLDGPVLNSPAGVLPVTVSGRVTPTSDLQFDSYLSQWGLQGVVWSALFPLFGHSLGALTALNSAAFSACLLCLGLLYRRIFSLQFGVLFVGAAILSPWLTSFVHSLYWMCFIWLLPAIFAALTLRAEAPWSRRLLWVGAYLAFTVKCLSGYEYQSALMLFAAAPFVYGWFTSTGGDRRRAMGGVLTVGLTGVLGFATALLIHAGIRGDTLLDGVKSILETNVMARTYGTINAATGQPFAGAEQTVWTVLLTYFMDWRTDVVWGLIGGAGVFPHLVLGSLVLPLVLAVFQGRSPRRDLALWISFILPPLSWFVLAKSHSAVHVHLNFVLWYLGFIPATLDILLNVGKRIFATFAQRAVDARWDTQ